jgi:hypothetical protein
MQSMQKNSEKILILQKIPHNFSEFISEFISEFLSQNFFVLLKKLMKENSEWLEKRHTKILKTAAIDLSFS